MKYVKIKGQKYGEEIEIKCSTLILGASDYLRSDNMNFATQILDTFIKMNGNTFDTARHYRHSEKALGEWMSIRNNRENIIILTKGCHPTRENPDIPRINPHEITKDLFISLDTLKTDYVDLYALHRDDSNVDVGLIIETLNKFINEGKIHAIGASNWSLNRIIEANKYAEKHGLIGFTFNSPNLSLAKCNKPRWDGCISADNDMTNWHEKTMIPVLSWSSQAGGFFSGRYSKDMIINKEIADVYYNDENWEKYNRLKKIAYEKNSSPICISLSYVLNQKFPTAAIIGPENLEELFSSYSSTQINLNQDEIDYLNLK